jgi:hypothetical protein
MPLYRVIGKTGDYWECTCPDCKSEFHHDNVQEIDETVDAENAEDAVEQVLDIAGDRYYYYDPRWVHDPKVELLKEDP